MKRFWLAVLMALQPLAASASGSGRLVEAPKTDLSAPIPVLTPALSQLPKIPDASQAVQAMPAIKAGQDVVGPMSWTKPDVAPEQQSAQAAVTFDGSAQPKKMSAVQAVTAGVAVAGGVALSAFVPGLPAAPLAVEAARASTTPRLYPEKRSFGSRVKDYAESALFAVPIAYGTFLAAGWGGMVAAAGIAGLWAIGAHAMIESIGQTRSRIVGGWQASHDQKYRHDLGTGELRDIRGRKYGEDRYDEKAPGEVTPAEQAAIRTIAATAGAIGLFLAHATPQEFLVFNLTLAGLYGLGWLRHRLAPPPPPPDVRPHDR